MNPKANSSRTSQSSQLDSSKAVDRDETIAMAGDAEPMPAFGPPFAAGEVGTLGPYRLVKELGRGGMGAVYAAVDTRLERKLALKVMLPRFAANATAKERFLREARAAAQIKHDNVVTLYEADVRDGVPYIAMEFLEGYPLDEYLKKKGSPTIAQTLRIAGRVASGLAAAHKIGLVHRDIKPGNLWLEAPSGRVKVLDFGLAKPVDDEVELTKSGAVVGTPAYMSPEQARGEKVDGRADLFSLGAVMYRLCAGRLPFQGATTMAVLMALGTEEPTPVRELNPSVPEPLADLIHQLLAKRPDDRPPSAGDVEKRIRAITEGLAAASKSTTAKPATSEPRMTDVPMHVTSPDRNPFGDLDSVTEVASEKSAASPKAPKPAPKTTTKATPKSTTKSTKKKAAGWLPWVVGGGLAIVMLAIGGVVIVSKINDNPKTKGVPPDGAIVKVKDVKTPTPVVPVTKPPPTTPPETKPPVTNPVANPPPAASDPDRKAAQYAIFLGGVVLIVPQSRDIKVAAELPQEPFTIDRLVLGGTKVTDADLANFENCKDLKFLHLGGTALTGAGLVHFKDRKEMWFLDLGGCTAMTDAGTAHFKGFKNIGHLNLHATKVTDAGLASFKECKGLGYFNLSDTAVTDAGLAHFKGASIGKLNLANTAITDAGLANFQGCTTLTDLNLQNTKVTGPGLASFKDCKGLGLVDLASTSVTDAGLAHLKDCKDLWMLNVPVAGLTDAGVVHFKDCKNLAHLNLHGTSVTDTGLAYFKGCKNLGYLGLFGTSVTDAGLASIQDCKALTYLGVRDTKVTAKGLEAFHAAVPGCKIEYDGGIFESKK